MDEGWAFWLYLLVVLLLWISSWNLVDLTVQHFVPSYSRQMLVYGLMFVFALLLSIVLLRVRQKILQGKEK